MAKRPGLAEVLQREVGRRLQAARKGKNFKQERLAADLRVSRTTLSNIERGKQRLFVDQVYEVARLLDIEVDELLPPLQHLAAPPAVRRPADIDEDEDDPMRETSPERLALAVQTVLGRLGTRRRKSPQSTRGGPSGAGGRPANTQKDEKKDRPARRPASTRTSRPTS